MVNELGDKVFWLVTLATLPVSAESLPTNSHYRVALTAVRNVLYCMVALQVYTGMHIHISKIIQRIILTV